MSAHSVESSCHCRCRPLNVRIVNGISGKVVVVGRREARFICTCSNAISKHSHCICNWHRSDRAEGHHYNYRSEASLAWYNRHINLGICENCWPLNGSGIGCGIIARLATIFHLPHLSPAAEVINALSIETRQGEAKSSRVDT